MTYNYEIIKRKRKRTKKLLVAAMGGKCQICRYNKCIEALDFHHINPEDKDFGLSNWSRSWDSIISESKKCILVCCRCHKEIHSGIVTIPDKFQMLDENWLRSQIDKNRIKEKTCPECKNLFTGRLTKQKYCSKICATKASRKIERPTRQELEQEIQNNTWISLGKKYGVSDNAVRKWAKKYNLI